MISSGFTSLLESYSSNSTDINQNPSAPNNNQNFIQYQNQPISNSQQSFDANNNQPMAKGLEIASWISENQVQLMAASFWEEKQKKFLNLLEIMNNQVLDLLKTLKTKIDEHENSKKTEKKCDGADEEIQTISNNFALHFRTNPFAVQSISNITCQDVDEEKAKKKQFLKEIDEIRLKINIILVLHSQIGNIII